MPNEKTDGAIELEAKESAAKLSRVGEALDVSMPAREEVKSALREFRRASEDHQTAYNRMTQAANALKVALDAEETALRKAFGG